MGQKWREIDEMIAWILVDVLDWHSSILCDDLWRKTCVLLYTMLCYCTIINYVLGFLMCCILMMRILCGMFLFFLYLSWKRMLLQCCSIIVLMPHGPLVSSIVLFSTFTSLCERNDTKSLWYFPKHAKLNSLLPFICTEE